jgi:hypothetical protein
MAKPWPAKVSTMGLLVDAQTPAPLLEDVVDTPPSSPPLRFANPRSVSDFASSSGSNISRRDGGAKFMRPTLQRSTTIAHPQPRGIPIGDLVNKFMNSSRSDELFKEVCPHLAVF